MKTNPTPNTCKNAFIEVDGFCNACGKRHYNPRKDASKQRLVAPATLVGTIHESSTGDLVHKTSDAQDTEKLKSDIQTMHDDRKRMVDKFKKDNGIV